MSFKSRLLMAMIIVTMGACLLVSMIAYRTADGILRKRAFDQLTSLRTSRAFQVESLMRDMEDQIVFLGKDLTVRSAMKELKDGFNRISNDEIDSDSKLVDELRKHYQYQYLPRLVENTTGEPVLENFLPRQFNAMRLQHRFLCAQEKESDNDTTDFDVYEAAHEGYHDYFVQTLKSFGYYDVFLIDPESLQIVYTTMKEVDFATSLENGPHSSSNLATVAQALKKSSERDIVVQSDTHNPDVLVDTQLVDTEEPLGEFLSFAARYDLLETVAGLGDVSEKEVSGWSTAMEGGPAVAAELSRPHIALADSEGRIYIADKDAHAVRRVSPTGTIETIAGNGLNGAGRAHAPHSVGILVSDVDAAFGISQRYMRPRQLGSNSRASLHCGRPTRDFFLTDVPQASDGLEQVIASRKRQELSQRLLRVDQLCVDQNVGVVGVGLHNDIAFRRFFKSLCHRCQVARTMRPIFKARRKVDFFHRRVNDLQRLRIYQENVVIPKTLECLHKVVVISFVSGFVNVKVRRVIV